MSRVGAWLLHLLFPSRCCLCGCVVALGESLCAKCRDKAPYVLPPVCDWCGRGEDRCSCRRRHRAYERCVMPFYYEGLGEQGIGQLKNTADSSVADGFAAEMAEVLRREYGGIAFDYVMPVPLYPADERQRGYNPSALLSRSLARLTGIAYQPLLRKMIRTAPQKELTAVQRSGNLLGVFTVDKPARVVGKTVLLVDDTVTTGATLDECAKMLKIYGAVAVYAITAAGAVKKEKLYEFGN